MGVQLGVEYAIDMHIELSLPKFQGDDDPIPLLLIADAMARGTATANGTMPFHNQTFRDSLTRYSSSVWDVALRGELPLANDLGTELKSLPADAPIAVYRGRGQSFYDQLQLNHPECQISEGVWDFSMFNLAQGEPDQLASNLLHYKTSVNLLRKCGWTIDRQDLPVQWCEWDLRDANGKVIEVGYYRGYVGGSKKVASETAGVAGSAINNLTTAAAVGDRCRVRRSKGHKFRRHICPAK